MIKQCFYLTDWYQLKLEFVKFNRDFYSDEAYKFLYDWYSDLNWLDDYELDVIAICCDWSEMYFECFIQNYAEHIRDQFDMKYDSIITKDDVTAFLEEQCIAYAVTDNDNQILFECF